MKTGRENIKIEIRACKYLLEIIKMGEDRWPKICLKEEMKRAKKGKTNGWIKRVAKTFEEVREGKIINLLGEGKEIERMEEEMKSIVNVKLKQDIQGR